MGSEEPWREKCIRWQDLISAWLVVMIEVLVVLVVFGNADGPCQPGNHATEVAAPHAQAQLGAAKELGGSC